MWRADASRVPAEEVAVEPARHVLGRPRVPPVQDDGLIVHRDPFGTVDRGQMKSPGLTNSLPAQARYWLTITDIKGNETAEISDDN